jgi:hypothetical protein
MTASTPSFESMQYGAPIGEYHGSVARIVIGVAGVALVLIGAFFAIVATTPSAAAGDSSGAIADIIASAIFIIGAIACFITVFVWRGARAQLFERGFVIARAGKATSARWEDIASVTQRVVQTRYYGIPVWTSHTYNVTLTNGDRLRITDAFGKVGKLGDSIQRMSANVLLPRAIAAYHSGALLPFGALNVSQAGISNGKETLPWSDLNQLLLLNGRVIITRKGKRVRWSATQISKTPNVYVLTALVGYIQRGVR